MAIQSPFLAGELRLRRVWLVLGWILVILVVYLSLAPESIQVDIEQGDKLSHAFAYLVLMSWFANLYETAAQRTGFMLGFICLAITLELFQRWTDYRSFEVADMLASAVGVVTGLILAPPRIPNYLQLTEKFLKA